MDTSAGDARRQVREGVAGNPATPTAVLEQLAGDAHAVVPQGQVWYRASCLAVSVTNPSQQLLQRRRSREANRCDETGLVDAGPVWGFGMRSCWRSSPLESRMLPMLA